MAIVLPHANIPSIPSNCTRGSRVEVLTGIYDDAVNIAIWNRQIQADILDYITWAKTRAVFPVLCLQGTSNQIVKELGYQLPEHPGKLAFIEDVTLITDMFCCLLGNTAVGLRLARLDRAMCPRFHTDRVTCRLITTYSGSGTEWLPEESVDRSRLAHGNMGLCDSESDIYKDVSLIQRLMENDVALLKGEAWEGNEGKGIVHRSPPSEKGMLRLLLTLDMI
jgi:hypothetical protein